jgi:hypothetical protein
MIFLPIWTPVMKILTANDFIQFWLVFALVFINKMFITFYFDLRFKCNYSSNHASYRLAINTIQLRRPELVRKDLKNFFKSKIKNWPLRHLALVRHVLALCAYYNFCSTRWDLSIDMGTTCDPPKAICQ